MEKEFFAVEASLAIPDEDGAQDVFILFFILFDTRKDAEKFLNITLQGVEETGQVCGRVFRNMRLIKAEDVEDFSILDGAKGIIKAVVDETLIVPFSLLIYNEKTKPITVGDALPMDVVIY